MGHRSGVSTPADLVGPGCAETMSSVVGALASWALMSVCVVCTFLCVVLACVASYRLYEFQTAASGFSERIVELEQHYNRVRCRGGDEAARQAAAWGAEVLAEVAAGVPANVAVQRSAARMHMPAVSGHAPLGQDERPAASEAGSDVSHVSELRGLGGLGADGAERVTTTGRSLYDRRESGSGTPTMTLLEFAGYRTCDQERVRRRRLRSSPPARGSPY